MVGVLGGVQWGLFASEWLEAAAAAALTSTPEGVELPSELAEITDGLQQALTFGGERKKYAVPALEHLNDLPIDPDVRAYCEHPEEIRAKVEAMSTAELAGRLDWLHAHRVRGLSQLDMGVQLEWTRRALGVGYFYGRHEPWLPTQLVHLAGRNAPARRLVLAALCLSMLKRAGGICITQPEAYTLWGIKRSTWWHVLAWLEERGLLVRLRRYKNNTSKRHTDAPVQMLGNWYGPGPELVARRAEVLAAFGDDATDDEAREAMQRMLTDARRDRRRELRRVEKRGTCHEAAPWLIAIGQAAWLDLAEEAQRGRAAEQARELLEGRAAADVFADPAPPPVVAMPNYELAAELERLAAERPKISAPVLLEQRERLAELEDVAATLRASQSAEGSGGAEASAGPAGRAADLRARSITVQSMDPEPLVRRSRQEGRPRKAAARPAGPAEASAPPEPSADCDALSVAATAGDKITAPDRPGWPSRARPEGGARTMPASAVDVAAAHAQLEDLRARAAREAERGWRARLRSVTERAAEAMGLSVADVLEGDP